MKIYARQVPPDYQESPLSYIKMEEFAGMYPGVYISGNRQYNGFTDDLFDTIEERFDDNRICRALSLLTGIKYKRHTIRGCCQGEWQNLYAPANCDSGTIQCIETEYFNLGTEWYVWTEEDGESEGFTVYWYGDHINTIKWEIAEAACYPDGEVTLYCFDGYTQTAKYKEA